MIDDSLVEQMGAALRVVRADIAMDPKKWSPDTAKVVELAWHEWRTRRTQ